MCSLFFSSIIINDQSNFCKMLSLILISLGFIWEYSIFEWWAVEVIGTHMQLIERFEFLFTLCIELDGRKKRRRHQKNRLNIELFGIWGGRERESEFSVHHTPIHTYMQHSQSSIIRTLSSNCKRWLNFEWFTTVEIVFEYSCMHLSICLSPSFSLPHSSAVVCVSSCVCMCLCECNRIAFLPVSMELSGQILILIGYRKHTKWLHCILHRTIGTILWFLLYTLRFIVGLCNLRNLYDTDFDIAGWPVEIEFRSFTNGKCVKNWNGLLGRTLSGAILEAERNRTSSGYLIKPYRSI